MPRAAELDVKVGWDGSAVRAGADHTESILAKMSQFAMTTGINVRQVFTSLSHGIESAVRSAADAVMTMDKAFVPIGTVLGANSKEVGQLKDGIRDLIRTTPTSADELGKGAYLILSAGITDTTKAIDTLRESTKLSQAGLGTVEDSANIITSAMNSFKDQNLSAADAAEVFFGAILAGKTTTAGLAMGFGQVAPLASNLKVSFKELMAATSALTGTGQEASTVYAGLRAAFANILSPTKEANEVAAELGINFSAAHLQSVGLAKFLEEIKAATNGDIQPLSSLFGSQEATSAMVSLLGAQGEAFAANLQSMTTNGKLLTERAKETTETTAARYEILKNRVQLALADGFKDIFVRVFAIVEKYSPQIEGLFWKVQYVITEVVGGLLAFKSAFVAFDGDVTSSGFPGFMEKVGFHVRRFVEFVRDNWPTVREAIGKFFDWFSENVAPTIRKEFGMIREAASTVVAFIVEHWPQISGVISAVYGVIKAVFELLLTLWDNTLDELKRFWNQWGDEIMAVLSKVFDFVAPAVEGFLRAVEGLLKGLKYIINGQWEEGWNAIKEGFLKWGQKLGEGIDKLIPGFTAFWTNVAGGVIRIFTNPLDSIKSAFVSVMNWLIGVWNSIAGKLSKIPGVPDLTLDKIADPTPSWDGGGVGVSASSVAGGTVLAGTPPEIMRLNAQRSSGVQIGTVQVTMPPGASGPDVVRALRDFQRRNGAIPIAVTGR